MDFPTPSLMPSSARTLLARVRNPLWSVAALVVVIWGLKEAQAVLLPVTVAALLAVICSPPVRWLERRRVPNVAAVLLTVAGLLGVLVILGVLVGGALSGFSEAIPTYRDKLQTMIRSTLDWLAVLGFDQARLRDAFDPGEAAGQAWDLVSSSMNSLVSALSNTFLVVLTMVLILMEGKTVPAKLRALSGDPHADISHYEQMASQVQSYLAIKTVLSAATGLLIGIWAAALDVDFAMLWGMLAFLLNYIPNIGSILAAVPAMLIAVIQHGPGNSLALGAGYVVVNMVLGNVVEPMWMGKKLGLSTTVVFLSLAIWYEIWGPMGMLLSVPLTMILKIMLEHSREGRTFALLLDTGESLLVVEEEERLEQPRVEEVVIVESAPITLHGFDEPPITPRSPGAIGANDLADGAQEPEEDEEPAPLSRREGRVTAPSPTAEPPRDEVAAEPPRDEVAAEPPRDEVAAEPPRDEVAAEAVRAPRDEPPPA
ncbi:MAG: AI-2E family transporter [Polyangiaceae bacterium]